MIWTADHLNALLPFQPVAFGCADDGAPWVILRDGLTVAYEDDLFILGTDEGQTLATAVCLPELLMAAQAVTIQ